MRNYAGCGLPDGCHVQPFAIRWASPMRLHFPQESSSTMMIFARDAGLHHQATAGFVDEAVLETPISQPWSRVRLLVLLNAMCRCTVRASLCTLPWS